MINLRITMTDGSSMQIKNHNSNTAIEFVRVMLKPCGVPAGWIEVMKGTVINVENIRSIKEISEGEVETANQMIDDDIVILPGEKENEEITPKGHAVIIDEAEFHKDAAKPISEKPQVA